MLSNQILLNAGHPREVANNAFLKLCRLDVNAETERWARTPPRFSIDGQVALITVESGFQSASDYSTRIACWRLITVHPVIATRWAGSLGRKSAKLVMIMCANTEFNPDSSLVSFSCRLSSPLRKLPDDERRKSTYYRTLSHSQSYCLAPGLRPHHTWLHGPRGGQLRSGSQGGNGRYHCKGPSTLLRRNQL